MSMKRKGVSLALDEKQPKRQETSLSEPSNGNSSVEEDLLVIKDNDDDDATATKILNNSTQETRIREESSNIGAINPGLRKERHRVEAHHSVLPLSMQLMKPFAWTTNSNCCGPGNGNGMHRIYDVGPRYHQESTPSFIGVDGRVVNESPDGGDPQFCSPIWTEVNHSTLASNPSQNNENENQIVHPDTDSALELNTNAKIETTITTANKKGNENTNQLRNRFTNKNSAISNKTQMDPAPRRRHLESIPPSPKDYTLPILQEYIGATQLYGCHHVNPGVLTALRFSLPSLRVSNSFHDADMLALSEILFRHCNGALKHIRRLDFSVAGRFGKLHGKKGFGSHGAFTLSRVLCISNHIEEVFLQKNHIGPYGAAAIFAAVNKNPVLKNISMRRCNIGEKGAFAFVEYMGKSGKCSLEDVDLTVNGIGFRGSIRIEEMLIKQEEKGNIISVDIEGNMVIQEIMNGVTHGLGVILCIVGFVLMNNKVKDEGLNKRISCLAYSISLLVLYISSTLYHSFFALKYTRYIFECLDHCAIYILITGSYTPFLRIALRDKPLGSFYLLIFIYLCCIGGVFVEAFHTTWVHKPKFSLAMYLGMGWSCLICLQDMMEVLPREAINLVILGGVGYTSGVPFFVRNNNLDHSIWHCFVLAGSIVHWLCVYHYVVPM